MTLPESETVYRQTRFQPPPGSTVLFVVRHGASEPARPGRTFPIVLGRGDPELAPEGIQQATEVCDRLKAAEVDAVYVTPLRRTAQTAAPLVAHLGVEPTVSADLIEVHLGEWEGGLFRQHVAEGHPLALKMRAEERWDIIPGAEPRDELKKRVQRGIEQIVAEHPGERVAIFTHGGVIGQIMAIASDSRPFAFIGADNGSLTTLVITPERWIIRGYNDTTHSHAIPL